MYIEVEKQDVVQVSGKTVFFLKFEVIGEYFIKGRIIQFGDLLMKDIISWSMQFMFHSSMLYRGVCFLICS